MLTARRRGNTGDAPAPLHLPWPAVGSPCVFKSASGTAAPVLDSWFNKKMAVNK